MDIGSESAIFFMLVAMLARMTILKASALYRKACYGTRSDPMNCPKLKFLRSQLE